MRHSFVVLFFWIIPFCIIAQDCNLPESPGLSCSTAPILCLIDGYCSTLPGSNPGNTPPPFCGFLENSHWLKFIAGSTGLSLQISPSGCASGMQGHIYFTDDCSNYSAVSNCFDFATFTDFTLTANNLTIGETYTILLDGKGGNVCDYEINVLSGMTLSPDNPDAGADLFLCPNQTILLSTPSSGDNIHYNWATIDGHFVLDPNIPFPTIDSAGQYILTAVDTLNGCLARDTVNVTLAPVIIANIVPADTIDCLLNQTVVLDGSLSTLSPSLQYNWKNADNEILSADTLWLEVSSAGEYVLVVEDELTNCRETDTIIVIANENTPIAQIDAAAELNCVTPYVVLDGGSSSNDFNFDLRWSTTNGHFLSDTNTLYPVVDAPGNYLLTIENTINNCIATADVTVFLNSNIPERAIINLQHPCIGESTGSISIDTVFGGNGTFTYIIDTSIISTMNVVNNLIIGTHHIKIQDAVGCTWDTIFTIRRPAPFYLELGDDAEICLGESFNIRLQTNKDLDELSSIKWLPDTSLLGLSPNIEPHESKTYTLILTDQDGCSISDDITIRVITSPKVYIPNIFSPNSDGINDVFYIQTGLGVQEIVKFQVFNRWGSLVYNQAHILPNDAIYGWDGTFRGELMGENVYIYSAEIQLIDGQVAKFNGSVVLFQ